MEEFMLINKEAGFQQKSSKFAFFKTITERNAW